MPAPVLIVSGGSAVGKSTVSRLLVARLHAGVLVPMDVILRFFDDPFPDPVSSEGAHRYEVVGTATAAAVARFAVGGYTVVLDAPMFPDGAYGVGVICGRRDVQVHYAVLRADWETCLERLQRRDPDVVLDFDGVRALHAKFLDLGPWERHVIDASGPADQVAGHVWSAFGDGLLAVDGNHPTA
jgi:predicted kinase